MAKSYTIAKKRMGYRTPSIFTQQSLSSELPLAMKLNCKFKLVLTKKM